MRTANVIAVIAALLWTGVTMLGRGLIGGVVDQRAAGYPSLGQIDWSIIWPLSVVAGISACAWLCNGFQRWPGFLGAVAVAALLALPLFLVLSGGGV